MLVGEPFMQQLPVPEYTDISDLLNSDLFSYNNSNNSSPPSTSSSPRSPADPFNNLVLTPPQSTTSFPTIASENDLYNANGNNMNLIQEELFSKSMFMSSTTPSSFDFFGSGGFADSPASTSSSTQASTGAMCIDPQLVDSPSVLDDEEEEEKQDEEAPPTAQPAEPEYTPPVKGKGRKNTVQSGGITKKTPKDKENVKMASFSPPPPSLPASIYKEEDDNDDLPADWRPPPEVYAKMSSKEKRQLRNKISARNFRIRRKEYITTLEGDIAERDRILEAIRSELGSSRSENFALRQEIAALKKVLLPGADGSNLATLSESPELSIESILNLPPPAPLPEISAAEMLAARATPSATSTAPTAELNLPNTQKDLPTSPRGNARSFWGGAHLGLGAGGFTPVHTAIMPEWPIRNIQNLPIPNAKPTSTPQLQENLNPAMNQPKREGIRRMDGAGLTPFEKFTDSTLLTYPSMDPYRMQLWKLVAAQNTSRSTSQKQQQPHVHQPQYQPQSQPTGLAANMRPHFFQPTSSPKLPTSSSPTLPHSTPGALAGLLSGKSRAGLGSGSSAYNASSSSASSSAKKDMQKEAEQAQRDVMVAALASQTLMGKLGSAFWEAFSGSPSSSSRKNLDAEKVLRVLEGKAVVKVVDVDAVSEGMRDMSVSMSAPVAPAASPRAPTASPRCDFGPLLEEGMRSLTLGKKH